jgi:hypothetical protein
MTLIAWNLNLLIILSTILMKLIYNFNQSYVSIILSLFNEPSLPFNTLTLFFGSSYSLIGRLLLFNLRIISCLALFIRINLKILICFLEIIFYRLNGFSFTNLKVIILALFNYLFT